MIQTGKNYVHGTSAEKLQYNVYEENKILKEKRKQRSNSKAKFTAVLYIIAVFMMCFVVILRYAMLTELNYKIAKESKKYNAIRNEYSQLKVQIEKELDLQKIKDMAEKKLGMQKPDKFQVVYVNVPKTDYTKIVDAGRKESMTTTNMSAIIMDKVGKLTRFLY